MSETDLDNAVGSVLLLAQQSQSVGVVRRRDDAVRDLARNDARRDRVARRRERHEVAERRHAVGAAGAGVGAGQRRQLGRQVVHHAHLGLIIVHRHLFF